MQQRPTDRVATKRWIFRAAAALGMALTSTAGSASDTWPPAAVITSQIPLSVNAPFTDAARNRPWFDSFSWQMFIALNWPVTSGFPGNPADRGVPLAPDDPSTFLNAYAGEGRPQTVWGSYKEAYELFSTGDRRPTAWTAPGDPGLACKNVDASKKQFVMVSKSEVLLPSPDGKVLPDINQAFSYPLIDQNLNYARSEVRYNKEQYDFIRGDDGDHKTWLYLSNNLIAAQNASRDGAIDMPASSAPSTQGSLMVKATWRQMVDGDDLSRYYTVDALIYDDDAGDCAEAKMGLVGFHIAQKLEQFPEWVWATFEQVDNVSVPEGAPAGLKPSFNNGTATPSTGNVGYADKPTATVPPLVPKAQRTAVQVSRLNPIAADTETINASFQQALAGTPWQYYELVVTQWPTDPGKFKVLSHGGFYPQWSGSPFPTNDAVNTVLETYFQSPIDASGVFGNSCMSCHYGAASADYSWVLMRRAH